MLRPQAVRGRPARRGIVWTSVATKIVCDGNSIMAGSNATSTPNMLPGRVTAAAPISGAITAVNLAIGGQTTRMMDGLDGGSSADVDAAWDGAKAHNLLLLWEGTNSIGSRTPAQAAGDMQTYIANRLAAHPWVVVLIGTLPRYESAGPYGSIAGYNDALLEYNRLCEASWRSWGCAAYVDPRLANGPFDFKGDWSLSRFQRADTIGLYRDPAYPFFYTHLSDAGFVYVAATVSAALKRL